jgi:hypothetical protein
LNFKISRVLMNGIRYWSLGAPMRTVLRALVGFVLGWFGAALCGFGLFFGRYGLLIPAILSAVGFVFRDQDFQAVLTKSAPGFWLLAVWHFIGGSVAGLILSLFVGAPIARWLDPTCVASACKIPPSIGMAGIIGGGIVSLIYLYLKTQKALPVRPAE